MTSSLTELSIKALPLPLKGQKYYPDKALSGFGIRVSQGGTKTFVLLHGIRKQKLLIGRHPIISLSEARAKARAILAEKTLGQYQGKSITFAKMRELFIAHAKRKNRATTAAEYERLLNRLSFDSLTLRPLDISRELKRFPSPSEQNHLLTALKALLTHAVHQGYLSTNPALSMPLPSIRRPRERVLTAVELKAIWHALSDDIFSTIVRLLILTGQRRSEVQHFQYADDIITIPADHTKNGKQHGFPAGTAHQYLGKDLTFNGWGKAKKRLDKNSGVTNWTLHDLRRTYATIHASLGTPIHVIERLLNHSSGTFAGVTGTYNRFAYFPDMKLAVLAYEKHIRGIVGELA